VLWIAAQILRIVFSGLIHLLLLVALIALIAWFIERARKPQL
jgi:hypothetical protein